MTTTEPNLSSKEIRKALRSVLVRMRNYALARFDQIGPRTLTALQDLDLFEDATDPIGANVETVVLNEPHNPRRSKLPLGPLLVYQTNQGEPGRTLAELPILLMSEPIDTRKAAFEELARMIGDGSLPVTLKTKELMETSRAGILSDKPQAWRQPAMALCDAFIDDILVSIEGIRQCLATETVIQDCLNAYVPRVLHPPPSSLDTVELSIHNPEQEHARMAEIIQSVIRESSDLQNACTRYLVRLGHMPLAAPYSAGAVVAGWSALHQDVDVWTEVWSWADDSFGPIPKYHACSVFVLYPDLIPEGKLPELWARIIDIVHDADKADDESNDHEPWMLRRDLARHYAFHLEACLPDTSGATISCMSWWLAERVASLFPDEPRPAAFYRKEWVKPAMELSTNVWLTASSRIGRSYLRNLSFNVVSPWSTAMMCLMGTELDRLIPHKQSEETQHRFQSALGLCLVGAHPLPMKQPDSPTFAQESGMGTTIQKWAAGLDDDNRTALEQLVAASHALAPVAGLCDSLRTLHEKTLHDQIIVTLALKAKAFTDPSLPSAAWDVVSDAEWRKNVLGKVDDRILGLVLEAFSIIQAECRDKWFSHYPHFIADLCESVEDEGRRRQLFLYVIHTSLAADSASAIQRLLDGKHKADFSKVIASYRRHVENMWKHYPPWVQGRLRALLASTH